MTFTSASYGSSARIRNLHKSIVHPANDARSLVCSRWKPLPRISNVPSLPCEDINPPVACTRHYAG